MQILLFVTSASLLIGNTVQFSCLVPCNVTTNIIPDYYWRDYIGIIPPDAIRGGSDAGGNPTYVGQAFFRHNELIPVSIQHGCKSAQGSAYNTALQTDKNIKILCSPHKHKFQWIPIKNEETHLLTNCHLVVGGSEAGHALHIGRVNHLNEETVVGKVFSYPLVNRGLWIPHNLKEAHYLSYEILTYDCKKKVCYDVQEETAEDI